MNIIIEMFDDGVVYHNTAGATAVYELHPKGYNAQVKMQLVKLLNNIRRELEEEYLDYTA